MSSSAKSLSYQEYLDYGIGPDWRICRVIAEPVDGMHPALHIEFSGGSGGDILSLFPEDPTLSESKTMVRAVDVNGEPLAYRRVGPTAE